jgi:transcriptional regulator with XRE-family HTH domain
MQGFNYSLQHALLYDGAEFLMLLMDEDAKARLIEKLIEAQAGRSQRRFAEDLDVSLGSVQNWLKGDSFPMVDKFEKIAASLGMSQESLFAYVVTGSEKILDAPPAVATRAEDVRVYAENLSVDEKVRLVGMIAVDIASQARLEIHLDSERDRNG